MTQAEQIKNDLLEKNISTKVELLEDGSYLSPAYVPLPVDYREIIPQESNPNLQTDAAFQALQTSILNTGFVFPVLISENPLYDPDSDITQRPDLREERKKTGRVVEVRDPEIRKYFKYSLVDGSHRFSSLLENDQIFERECGRMPCVLLKNKTEHELMSAEILMNPISSGQVVQVLR